MRTGVSEKQTLLAKLQNCLEDGLVADLILLRLCLRLVRISSLSFKRKWPATDLLRISNCSSTKEGAALRFSCSSLLTTASTSKHRDLSLCIDLLP